MLYQITRRGALAPFAAGTILDRHAQATDSIRIGMPCVLTGSLGSVSDQMRCGAELWARTGNAKGGILGRPIELFISDTGSDPASCARKAQEAVERDNCHLLFGMTLSSEALAVALKFVQWNAIFISSDNSDGRLTGESLVPNFFRANISGPMGARGLALFARRSLQKLLRPCRGLCLGPQQQRGVQE
jgi:branched-chain amino acid transport system substrate-binding protein